MMMHYSAAEARYKNFVNPKTTLFPRMSLGDQLVINLK